MLKNILVCGQARYYQNILNPKDITSLWLLSTNWHKLVQISLIDQFWHWSNSDSEWSILMCDCLISDPHWSFLTPDYSDSWPNSKQITWRLFLPPPNEVWDKVLFSEASVCPQGVLSITGSDITTLTAPILESTPRIAPPTPWSTSGRYASYWNAFLSKPVKVLSRI